MTAASTKGSKTSRATVNTVTTNTAVTPNSHPRRDTRGGRNGRLSLRPWELGGASLAIVSSSLLHAGFPIDGIKWELAPSAAEPQPVNTSEKIVAQCDDFWK
ncbi:MAG: hypothetical protein NVS3B20_22980 [Polyangiales bacterium]